MLIDNEPWILMGIEKTFKFEQYGFRVVGKTTSPKQALKMIDEELPDIVFTDIKMPGLTGLELIKKVKKSINTLNLLL